MTADRWDALTDRQREVAELVAKGYGDKVIAARLGISPRRVRQCITRIAVLWRLDAERNYRTQITDLLARVA